MFDRKKFFQAATSPHPKPPANQAVTSSSKTMKGEERVVKKHGDDVVAEPYLLTTPFSYFRMSLPAKFIHLSTVHWLLFLPMLVKHGERLIVFVLDCRHMCVLHFALDQSGKESNHNSNSEFDGFHSLGFQIPMQYGKQRTSYIAG